MNHLGDLYRIIHDLPVPTRDRDLLLERISDLSASIIACRWTGDRKLAYQRAFDDEIIALCWDSERVMRQR